MIEKIVRDWLEDNLSVHAFTEVPENAPASYVLIEKTSGGESNHIISATIAVKSIAPTLYQASALNESVKQKMALLRADDNISKISLNSDYNFTDTESKRYQYQSVFDIIHY